MEKFLLYFRESRPQYLLLALICALVGAAAAYWKAGQINITHLIIIIIGAVASHTAVNVLNDYFDFKSGLDLNTKVTPFSGGSGILPAGQMSAKSALYYGLAALAVTVAIGIYFVIVSGWGMLLVGLPGILMVWLYTEHITRSPLLCLLAPGLGFGPCMVLGAYFALQGSYDWTAAVASAVPGFLVSNLLLLNQFPDTEADREAGRLHFPILIGKNKSAVIYSVFAIATYLWIILSVSLHLMPVLSILALLPIPLALKTIKGVYKNSEQNESLIPFLGQNVVFTLATPLLLAIGLFFS